MIDILIVGGGPAGLTAAIYAARAGLAVTVAERLTPGGQMAATADIDNYPGVPGVTGPELSLRMEEHAQAMGAAIVYREVTALSLTPGALSVMTNEGAMQARALILAMGAGRRRLGVPGEDAFAGRGVSYCAVCDGGFFRGKDVAVVGGGKAALEDALYLSGLCRQVTLIHRRDTFRAARPLVDALRKSKNVRLMLDSVVEAVEGQQAVERVSVRGLKGGQSEGQSGGQSEGQSEILPVSGLFVAIGTTPESGLLRGVLPLDAEGRAIGGDEGKTDIPGVFVAGDLRKKGSYQIVTACADGAQAAIAAAAYLNDQ